MYVRVTLLFSIMKGSSNPKRHDFLIFFSAALSVATKSKTSNHPANLCGKRLSHLFFKLNESCITSPHLNTLGFQGILECYLGMLGGRTLKPISAYCKSPTAFHSHDLSKNKIGSARSIEAIKLFPNSCVLNGKCPKQT